MVCEKRMPGSVELFEKYPNPVFVETGSFKGTGIQQALDAGFERVISIEISQYYYSLCRERFRQHKNVEIIYGDSGVILYDVIKTILDPITFWLDGHFFGQGEDKNMGKGNKDSPVVEELICIRRHHLNTHTIIIDDLRCWFKENQLSVIDFNVDDLKKILLDINKDYNLIFEDSNRSKNDILVAGV